MIISYFANIALKDDRTEIEKVVKNDLTFTDPEMVHIDLLDKKTAQAIFEEQTGSENLGYALMKKNIFGWKQIRASTSNYPKSFKEEKIAGWSFSNYDNEPTKYTDLVIGKIFDHGIEEEVLVIPENG